MTAARTRTVSFLPVLPLIDPPDSSRRTHMGEYRGKNFRLDESGGRGQTQVRLGKEGRVDQGGLGGVDKYVQNSCIKFLKN